MKHHSGDVYFPISDPESKILPDTFIWLLGMMALGLSTTVCRMWATTQSGLNTINQNRPGILSLHHSQRNTHTAYDTNTVVCLEKRTTETEPVYLNERIKGKTTWQKSTVACVKTVGVFTVCWTQHSPTWYKPDVTVHLCITPRSLLLCFSLVFHLCHESVGWGFHTEADYWFPTNTTDISCSSMKRDLRAEI